MKILLLIGLQSKEKVTAEIQGGRGHWAVYYTSPQSFIIAFSSYLLAKTTYYGSRTNAGVPNVGVDKRRSDKRRSGQTQECLI